MNSLVKQTEVSKMMYKDYMIVYNYTTNARVAHGKTGFHVFNKRKRQLIVLKAIEFFGVLCGIVGAFLVANGMMQIGYPLFTASSAALLFTAFRQGNKNLMGLQGVFLCANINGLVNFL